MVRTVIAAAVLIAAAPLAAQTAAAPQAGETLLEVQAEGQARVIPDRATITVGVVATGITALEATNAASAGMTKIGEALQSKGVSARDMRTQQINVEPRFQRNNPADYQGQAQIVGYVARNSATITIRKLDAAPAVIAAAFGAGANSVYGPNLGTEKIDAGMSEARSEAIRNARAQADEYAAGFNLKIGRVIRVSERGSNVQPNGSVVVTGSSVAASPAPPPPAYNTPFSRGDLLRTTRLWIDFALVPK